MNTAVPIVWRMDPTYGLQESSRLTPSDRLGRVTVGRRGWGQRQAGQHTRGRAGIAVTIIGMRRVVWLSLIPVFSFPCLHVLSRTGSDPTGRCGMVGVQRVESGDFHRGRPVFARLQTELACRFRRTADGEWSSSFPSTYMQNRLIPTFSRYLPKFLNKKIGMPFGIPC